MVGADACRETLVVDQRGYETLLILKVLGQDFSRRRHLARKPEEWTGPLVAAPAPARRCKSSGLGTTQPHSSSRAQSATRGVERDRKQIGGCQHLGSVCA